MKKIVALMLSSVMLLSVLSVIPSAVLADGTGGASDVIADINFETQEPVSYTHLDVYKRQAIPRIQQIIEK